MKQIKKIIDLICQKNFFEAEDLIKTSLKKDQNNQDLIFLGGIIKANQKRFIEAAKLFEKFLAHTKDHFDGNLNLAGCYHEMGEFEKAILYYNKCIELKSNVTEVYRRLAMCYRFKREYKKAIETINQDPNLNNSQETLLLLGNIFKEMGSFDHADVQFKKLLNIFPDFFDGKLAMAILEIDKGNLLVAKDQLKNLLSVNGLTISSDDGLVIGAGSDLTITVGGVSGTDVTFANTSSNGDIIFTVNDAGVTKEVLRMDGSAGRIDHLRVGDLTVDGTQTIINTTTLSVEDNIIELNRNVSSNAGMPNYTGLKVNRGSISSATEQALYWVWDETFSDAGYGDAGGAWTAFKAAEGDTELEAPTLVDIRANIVHATSTSAQYADLAERSATDVPVEAGDVVILGGSQEITLCTKELDDAVFGVVSERPAYLMNAEAGNNDSHPMIALKGRVRVKIAGTGSAGDRIVSAGNGTARVAALEECTAFNTLGRMLKAKYSQQTELHECVIGIK